MILHDQHVHTNYSRDSKQKLEAYYQKAKELNCTYVMTCEHVDFASPLDGITHVADLDTLKEEMALYSQKYDIKSLLGVELGYRHDYIKELLEVMHSQDFDVINLSVHDNGHYDFYCPSFFKEDGVENVLHVYFMYVLEASQCAIDYDVLSHIDYGYKTARMVDSSISIKDYEKYLIAIMQNVIKRNKALEINLKVQKTINDDNHLRYLLNLYKSLGGTNLTLSSDSHVIEDYHDKFAYYMQIIKECGFDNLSYFIKRKEYLYSLK